MAKSVLTGGPLRELKWGGITFRPTKDGEPEHEYDGTDYTSESSPNGDFYVTGEKKTGYVQQECAMNPGEFDEFKALQDGTARAGTATMPNGDVLSLNCIIDGEHLLTNGKVTVRLAGSVRLQ